MLFNRLPLIVSTHEVPTHEVPTEEGIRYLPQFYRADLDMVWRLGNVFLRSLIERLHWSQGWKYVSIDSRQSMLMQGTYPCIPGWHCDDFYRPVRNGSQPDLTKVESEAPSEHFMMLYGDCSKTQFVNEPVDLDIEPVPFQSLYGSLHHQLEAREYEAGGTEVMTVEPGQLVWFSPLSLHRGMPATKAGWRYFIRFTGSNHRQPKNELRTQTQIYMTEPFAGW